MHADEWVQGAIAILFTAGILWIAVTQRTLDPNISASWALILGFYFGSKTTSRTRSEVAQQITEDRRAVAENAGSKENGGNGHPL